MKTTVNRVLRAGIYLVSFKFTDFTPDERMKMEAFGVPSIGIQYGQPPAVRNSIKQPITQIDERFIAGFLSQAEAKNYEAQILSEVRTSMQALRDRKDDFTSTEEVNI
jgi:hypothetical protein